MKPPVAGRFMSIPLVAVLLLLSVLCLCPGCDNTQGGRIGDRSPALSGSDIKGDPVSLGRFRGNVLLLYFWSASCCGERVRQLEPLYHRYRDRGVAILAVNVGDARQLVESYAAASGLTFTLLADERAMIARQYGVAGFPTLFILDGEGIIRKKVLGDMDVKSLQHLVEQQIAARGQGGKP
jgi:peroxiredoxin